MSKPFFSALTNLLSRYKSPWTALRSDEALRQEIQQDVDRCMPDNLYFRQPATQNMLVDILFVWSKLNQDVSYRQGMHEVLAPVVWTIERDAISMDTGQPHQDSKAQHPSLATTIFDANYIEHDCFTLFNIIMQNVKSAYETVPVGSAATSAGSSRDTARTDPPMVLRARKIMDVYLERTDPPLAAHLRKVEILPQVFLMRWIRLIFGREFTFDQTLTIWDALFANDPSLDCLDLVCVSMLLRIRWQLIDADYNSSMTLLFKYPPFVLDRHPASLINDAIYLQSHLDFDGGYHVIGKQTNRPPPLINRPASSQLLHERTTSDIDSQQDASARPLTSARLPAGLESLVQDAARSVFARSEKLGLTKAVRDAVGEVKKNLQPPIARLHSRTTSATDDSLAEASSRNVILRIEALEQRNKQLAKMLEGAIDDLWSQHKEVVENRPADDERTEPFTMAIAKVQLAAVYLEDSTLPLPQEDSEAPTNHLAHSSRAVAVGKPTKPTKSADVTNNPTPIKHASRPSTASRPALEQSSFSWMLGQGTDDKTSARSAFMSASPFSVRDAPGIRSNGFLFGDEDGADFARRGSESNTKDKKNKRDKVKGKDVEPEDEEVRLGTLNWH